MSLYCYPQRAVTWQYRASRAFWSKLAQGKVLESPLPNQPKLPF
ncbi:hypothetical protein yrohd0001_8120 [Yersinia rohdei ATCC 43380]|nr:hypothetical protein yrohd0001_8120 [Yersinia rohdei ATCC 43380]